MDAWMHAWMQAWMHAWMHTGKQIQHTKECSSTPGHGGLASRPVGLQKKGRPEGSGKRAQGGLLLFEGWPGHV